MHNKREFVALKNQFFTFHAKSIHFEGKFEETKIIHEKISYEMIYVKVNLDPTVSLEKIEKMVRVQQAKKGIWPQLGFLRKVYN